MASEKIGFLGLGNMGKGIAGQLVQAGFDVCVYNRSASACDELVARGARRASSPADAVEAGGVAITMLANDAALEEVTRGANGFIDRLGAGALHISMSTVSPTLAASLAEAHQERGSAFLAAPVFGRPEAAAAGKLWIAQSGAAAAKERALPVLNAVSQGIFDMGDTPAAAPVAKIAGNFLIAAAMEAMAESFALVANNGGDARAFHSLFSQTFLASPVYQNYGRLILERAFSPPGFKLELGAKDLGLVLANGRETHTPMPLASLLHNRFLAGIAKGRADLDWVAIALDVAGDAGIA